MPNKILIRLKNDPAMLPLPEAAIKAIVAYLVGARPKATCAPCS
jgi:hypothetical protein